MGLGFPEVVVILIVSLAILGGGRLPAIGERLGRWLREQTEDEDTSGEDLLWLATVFFLLYVLAVLVAGPTR